MKILTNYEYARLKGLEKIAERLQSDKWKDLSFEESAELLLKIGKGDQSTGHRSKDAETIKAIGIKWLNEIHMAYNNKGYNE